MAEKKVPLDPIEARIDAMMKDKLRSLGIEVEEEIEERNDLEFTASQLVINREMLQHQGNMPQTSSADDLIRKKIIDQYKNDAVILEKEINSILVKFRSNNPKVEAELNKIKNLLANHRNKFEL